MAAVGYVRAMMVGVGLAEPVLGIVDPPQF
jgi:hypothetical protein